jgi:histidine triad (HIT) family protein
MATACPENCTSVYPSPETVLAASTPNHHMSHSDNCIFCKIAAGAIPSRKVYEDDELFAFHDLHPWAPVHFMIIPKAHIPSMAQVGPEHAALLGRMMVLAPKLALEQGCNPYPEGGFRILTNTGAEGGQEVHHLHIHVIGGPRPWLKG